MYREIPGPCLALKLTVFAALTVCAFSAAHAHADGQKPSSPAKAPLAGSLSVWPEAASLPPGTRVMITTSSDLNEAYPCKLARLDERGVRCNGRHHRMVIFDRETVRTMALPAQSFHNVVLGFAIGSAVLTGGGLLCAIAGGGGGCVFLLASGLSGALLTPILHAIDEIHGHGVQTPVYMAAPPSFASGELD